MLTPRPLLTLGKDPVPIVQEAGWAPGPVWTGAENLASTGIRSPDRQTSNQSLPTELPAHIRSLDRAAPSLSLYRLRYRPTFDPRTVQPLASLYTDYATGPIRSPDRPAPSQSLYRLRYRPTFDPWTVQPVASRYTDYTTGPHSIPGPSSP